MPAVRTRVFAVRGTQNLDKKEANPELIEEKACRFLARTYRHWLRDMQRDRPEETRSGLRSTAPPFLALPTSALFSFSPQIETSQLEPEIARATSSRTVVYNKGL